MDLLCFSISSPPSMRLGSIAQGNVSKGWQINGLPQLFLPLGNAGSITCQDKVGSGSIYLSRKTFSDLKLRSNTSRVPRSTGSSSSNGSSEDTPDNAKVPFGYTRKDVLLIGLGVTAFGVGLKYGLEFVGVDPLQSGNVVQLVLVLGMTVGWISTYIFRVSNKDMTYAKQLRDYEYKVMQKRLEGLTEAEIEALLEQVEEEKQRLARGNQVE